MIKTIPITYSIFHDDENPIFGETATHIKLDDENAGAFLIIEQDMEGLKEGQVKIELEELEVICKLGREMIQKYNKETKP